MSDHKLIKKASDEIDTIYKLAASNENYQKDIKCQQCGYEGQPEYNGKCPVCGAIGGVLPHDNTSDVKDEGLQDKNFKSLDTDSLLQNRDFESII